MIIEKVKISSIKPNPNNPRLIKDIKFKTLVKSIKEFPQMLEVRPIVVDEDMIVLGGNMRLKACKEAGLTEVHIIKFSNLTEDQKKEFIIKDNVGFGDWDWNVLTDEDEWNIELLNDWGLTTPKKLDEEDVDDSEVETLSLWFLNIQMDNEKDCQLWYDKLTIEGLKCKIVQ